MRHHETMAKRNKTEGKKEGTHGKTRRFIVYRYGQGRGTALIFRGKSSKARSQDSFCLTIPLPEVLVRLNNCSEQDASLNLTVPKAQYLQGEFSVMNIYHDMPSYSRPGENPRRQLVLSRRENVQRIPTSCAKWLGSARTPKAMETASILVQFRC